MKTIKHKRNVFMIEIEIWTVAIKYDETFHRLQAPNVRQGSMMSVDKAGSKAVYVPVTNYH